MQTDGSHPSVSVVGGQEDTRQALCRLGDSVGYRTFSFGTPAEFLDACRSAPMEGCALLDVPAPSGLAEFQRLLDGGVDVPVIILADSADVPMVLRAIKMGAYDFIEKPVSGSELLEKIRSAVHHDARVRRLGVMREEARRRMSRLTGRETEVMNLVVGGHSNKGVAQELGISQKTVEQHRAQVMRKMRVRSLAELVRLVLVADLETEIPPPRRLDTEEEEGQIGGAS